MLNIEEVFIDNPKIRNSIPYPTSVEMMVRAAARELLQDGTEQQKYRRRIAELNKLNFSSTKKFRLAIEFSLPKSYQSEVTGNKFYLTEYPNAQRIGYTRRKQ